MAEHSMDEQTRRGADVDVVTTGIGPDQYSIVATALFESAPADVWSLLWDWQRLVAVGLPGMTSDFRWLSGSPDEVPSTFQFEIAGAVLKEEIYERTSDAAEGQYRLRYRALEPALGVLEYDAVVQLQQTTEGSTAFSATREVRLAPGTTPDMLAEMIESETRYLKDHFRVG